MTDEKGNQYVTMGVLENHAPIVTSEIFEKVQWMMAERSNIEYNSDGTRTRKSTHYSIKAKEKD